MNTLEGEDSESHHTCPGNTIRYKKVFGLYIKLIPSTEMPDNILFFFGCAGAGTQDLTLARQALLISAS
jgi:hypothetical protein